MAEHKESTIYVSEAEKQKIDEIKKESLIEYDKLYNQNKVKVSHAGLIIPILMLLMVIAFVCLKSQYNRNKDAVRTFESQKVQTEINVDETQGVIIDGKQ